jgi:hypothetical protein
VKPATNMLAVISDVISVGIGKQMPRAEMMYDLITVKV